MIFAIVNRQTLKVLETYVSDEKDDTSRNRDYSRAEPICIHIPVPENLDADCLISTTWQALVTIVDEPAYTIPAKTHQAVVVVEDQPAYDVPPTTREETVIIIDEPEVLDPETNEVITPAVTHEETVTVEVAGYTVPAVTHEETITITDEPEQIIPAVTHEELQDFYGVEESADKLAAKQLVTKQALVTAAYNRMEADVLAGMAAVYGTSKADSATAYQLTWEKMVSNPALFVDQDLGFASESEVLAYATPKLEAANAYAVNRLKRIAQFKTEREAILV